MSRSCKRCRHNNNCEIQSVGVIGCSERFQPKPRTNAMKIRSMNDEELAEFISEMHDEEIGKFLGDIATCDNNIKSIFEWLQSEVEV